MTEEIAVEALVDIQDAVGELLEVGYPSEQIVETTRDFTDEHLDVEREEPPAPPNLVAGVAGHVAGLTRRIEQSCLPLAKATASQEKAIRGHLADAREALAKAGAVMGDGASSGY